MSLIDIQNIQVLNNPAPFLQPIQFNITMTVLKELPGELDWDVIYVGSAKDEKHDISLDSFQISPLTKNDMAFKIQTNPPDVNLIPTKEDLIGVTAIILSVSYKKQEFFRCGFYVYNQYVDPELIENDPPEVQLDKLQRNILSDKPRITRFPIKWEEDEFQTTPFQNILNIPLPQVNNLPDVFGKSNGIFQQIQSLPSYNTTMFGPDLSLPNFNYSNQQQQQFYQNPISSQQISQEKMQLPQMQQQGMMNYNNQNQFIGSQYGNNVFQPSPNNIFS